MLVGASLLWLCTLGMAAPKVAVVGAGVIGLSTALCIAETCPSCSVTVLSDQFSPNTTSDVAAGMLIPHTYPGACNPAWCGPWHRMRLRAWVCSDAQRFRKKSAVPCIPHLPCLLDMGLDASPLCIFPLCMFGFVYMQAHRSMCRSSGSKRPSLTFLPSATQRRHQKLAFTWSPGKNSPPELPLVCVCPCAGAGSKVFLAGVQAYSLHGVALMTVFPRNCTAAAQIRRIFKQNSYIGVCRETTQDWPAPNIF